MVVSVTVLAQNAVQLRILKAEDERRWDADLKGLLADSNPAIRKRAALATGRIGNEDSVSALADLLQQDKDTDVRAMAAFAIGEVEAATGADPLLVVLKNTSEPLIVRARAIEALGKIAGALSREQEARRLELGAAILDALNHPTATSDRLTAMLGLTAALRSRPANAGPTIAKFLAHSDARVRADAGNTLARLRLNAGNDQLRKLLDSDADPIVRANAARVLGITEDKASYDSILKHALEDLDSRVRVSAIRSLALLKDDRAADKLIIRGFGLFVEGKSPKAAEINEVLEIATTLGRLLALKDHERALSWLAALRDDLDLTAPEIEVAAARMNPAEYVRQFEPSKTPVLGEVDKTNWRSVSAIAAGLRELATLPDSVKNKAAVTASAESLLRTMLDYRNNAKVRADLHVEYAIPECSAPSLLSSRKIYRRSCSNTSTIRTSSCAERLRICLVTCRRRNNTQPH